MHDLLRVADVEADELLDLLELAVRVKADRDAYRDAARGRVAAILFEKPSLRTRFSIEAALIRVGAHPIGAYDREVGLGSREPIPDVAKVLARYADAIAIRTFGHERARALAEASDVPVVNALSDEHHPLQALADLMTVAESCCDGDLRSLKGLHIAYIGDGNNVAHSLIEACALAGMTVACACPDGCRPSADVVRWARDRGGDVAITDDPSRAVRDAVAVYTDVWTSMGREDEAALRRARFEGFEVSSELMSGAHPDAIFLHCLPAHRGEEVAADVIDGAASRVFDQAENRMHTAAAVFLRLFDAA
jgi:ornithine carbamoyltransferase